ncbi:uncharacterized protein LOC105250047 isoform X3 [Camponotus floridanus]|uniref:uncharacterized protein LOC105250047 isoform X3 n=1 Tax=Camponotus floridanus TaxID=104421 RepID=UPI00097167AA|nr:uncharacterized protein LOC105250047 isoform X3 [Camponotus floridanus]
MPINSAKLDEVRKILLSLLLARPGSTSVAVLDQDYYEVEGERIPWRKFGFADLVDFLSSMPEHFVIEWYNGGHHVRGIASEKTKHSSTSQNVPRSPARETVCVGGEEGSDFSEELDDEGIFVPSNYVSNNYPKQSQTSGRIAASFPRSMNNEQNAMLNHNDDVDDDNYLNDLPEIASLIDNRTKSRLDQLIRKHPEGIWCADLPEQYFKEYNVHLNYKELGFMSVRDYVSYLTNIFYMTQENLTGDFLLYTADNRPIVPDQDSRTESTDKRSSSCEQYDEHNGVRRQYDNDDNAPIPADVSPTITKIFAPEDTMNYNDSVDQISVTDLQSTGNFLEVYIVEIFHPTFFWIHLRENRKDFDKLMGNLHNYYQRNKDKYTIPKIALKKGLNCACIYAGKWHRGIIKSVKPDFRVTIMFYDYGTLKTYASEDVYYLHKQFCYLPAQAIPCGLYNVRPCVGDRWKKSVIDQLVDRISETLLALTIISVDPSNNSMMVILTDTSEEEDVHINDWLINEKLARCGKMGDAVDMASIMKYVVNNLNQLPTYCFAEESLMSDSRCCKATSTEELHEVPLVSSKQTHPCGFEQHTVRPPPGFAPLDKKPSLSSTSTISSSDTYSFGNTPNVRTPSYGNEATNPFLNDQQLHDNVISNDAAKQIFTPIWSENMQLFIKLTEILYDLLGRSPLNRSIFENHMSIQHHLNKFLRNFEETLAPDSDRSTIGTSSASLKKETSSKVDSVEKMPVNSNAESFVNQNLAGMSNLSLNPFDDDKLSQTHNMFSAYGSNGYTFGWHQSDRFSPHIQVTPISPSPATPTPMFANYGPAANVFLPNPDQGNENPSATKPISSTVPNADICNNNHNSSAFNFSANNEFAKVIKETNPFKFSMINNMQMPEKQNEWMANNCDTNATSYQSVKNLNDQSSKMETVNVNAGSKGFPTTADHVNVNGVDYTPKIVYEAGPVMYNVQKKEADVKRNSDFKNDANVPSREHCNKELSSQSVNDGLYLKHDSYHIDEAYVSRLPTDYTSQNSPPIINESIYHQQNKVNERVLSSQAWKKVEIPERWMNSHFPNDTSLQNHSENSTINTSINSSLSKDSNNTKESENRGMNGTADLNYIFQWNDKETSMDMYKNFWNNPSYKNQKFEYKNGSDYFFDTSFVFQKIDSVKNATLIFHSEGEGWILTQEFVQIFTHFKTCSYMISMLETMHIKATFKQVQRSDYPVQFLQLDHYPLHAIRDSNMRIESIHLISLQSALSLLHKLKIVTREEIDNAFKKNEFVRGSVLPDMWMIIVIYRDLKRRIEQCNLLI